tara:strand:+ start:2472 stop:3602 length:1131 start_codon:yes stop_codon:yes gene_type:complete
MKINLMMRYIFLICFISLVNLNLFSSPFTDSIKTDYKEYARSGNYYPYTYLTDEDSLEYPIYWDVQLNVDDLYDLDIGNNFFTSEITAGFYIKYDSIFELSSGGVFPLYPFDHITMETKEPLNADAIYRGFEEDGGSWFFYGYIPEEPYEATAYELNYKNVFNHKWNLREYPFDVQEMKIEFIIPLMDSSIMRLRESKSFPPTFNKDMDNFRDGYKITSIRSEVSYFETPYQDQFVPDSLRNIIGSKLTFYVGIDRSGSFLFTKLFGGSFCAFIISWLAFFIPRSSFDTRISLNMGAIFGAIGNRYFVDSSLSNIQVMTKSDIINYICIALLIFNIIIIIIQKNDNITWSFFEKGTNALIFSAALFTALILLVVFW